MRSTRKRTRVTYREDDALSDEDLLEPVSNQTTATNSGASSQLVVDKILGRKFVINPDTDETDEMFLIKWRGMSYIHISWEFREDVERVDLQGKVKIRRFLSSPLPLNILGDATKVQRLDEQFDDDEDVEYFNPELAEIQRVISCDTPTCIHSGCSTAAELESMASDPELEINVYYLVKWRGAPYSDCTWERWEDIKYYAGEVFAFWQRQRPPKAPMRAMAHPSIQDYHKLEKSPMFGAVDEESGEESGLMLRDYQLEGVNWLLWNWWHKRPCILADEMGLGKTIQTVCFLHQLQHMSTTQVPGPFLVVAPLSLVNQWQSEVALWSPGMNCVVLHGSAESRDIIQQHEFFYSEPFTSKADVAAVRHTNPCKFDILLTTYEIVMKEVKLFAKIKWKVLVVDEAHRLKNQTSRLFEQMKMIPRDQCVLLTGTPLQNKTEELWALLHFADAGKFSNQGEFVSRFGDLRDSNDVAELHGVLKPYLLRRVKEDVEKSLPPKEETIVEVTLTSLQKQFYRAIYERNTQFLFKGAKANNQPSLMNVMMELRKCCNHPYLIKGVEDRIVSEMPVTERTEANFHRKLVECSGKLLLLDKLLPRLYEEGHKVLIFSQMVKVLNLLEDYLRHQNYLFERLDGSTRSTDRNQAVERFCRPSLKRFIMLLSTKAGGLGLNLTSADTVIIFDSDWNPHNDMQAQARAHRIGQKKAVMVYRLLTRKTYEMHMFHKASLKLGLDRAVLAHARNEQEGDDDTSDSGNSKGGLQVKEIDELLKRGAYDIFREDDTEQTEFAEADIDSIMQRRSHKVSYEGISENSLSSSLGGFSKASFVSADEKEDVDINDPDFWKKAIGFEEPEISTEDPFAMNLPSQRKRKQTQVYGEEHSAKESEIDELLEEDAPPEPEPSAPPTKKEKKASEPKPPKEPKEKEVKAWGPHSRDRLIRALQQFGFGRWQRIQKESGAANRDRKDVETFARAYMMQCGLCAGETASIKGDTQFITDAINGAKKVNEMIQAGQANGFEIPPILQDEKYLSKLKANARKTLQKLELLAKLISMIGQTVEEIQKKNPDIVRADCLDSTVKSIPPKEIASQLPLGNVRPAWTRPRSWWDDDCDRHLLVGVFLHGYGRYNDIGSDPNLVFQSKMKDWAQNAKEMVKAQSDIQDAPSVKEVEVTSQPTQYSEEGAMSMFTLPSGQGCRLLVPNVRYSSYVGVYSQPGSVKWLCQYGDNVKSTYIGTFDCEVDAAMAYDEYVHAICARTGEGEEDMKYNFVGGERVMHEIDREKTPGLPWHRSSKYRGVRASGSKWTAQISYDGGNHHLGTFCTELEAAVAYDVAAQEHHGSLAVFNFPNSVEMTLKQLMKEPGVVVEFLSNDSKAKLESDGNKPSPVEGSMEVTSLKGESDSAVGDSVQMDVEQKDVNGCAGKSEPPNSNQVVGTDSGYQSIEGSCDKPVPSPVAKKDKDEDDEDEEDEGHEEDADFGDDQPDGEGDNDADGDQEVQDKDKKKDESPADVEISMPDARLLNRLFAWLVSSEAARLTKEDLKKRQKATKKARLLEIAERKAQRAQQQVEDEKRQNIRLGEKGILSLNYELFEADAQLFADKKALLRKCEAALRKSDDSADSGNGAETVTAEEGQNSEGAALTEDEIQRICCALLLYGAPFSESKLPLPCASVHPVISISPYARDPLGNLSQGQVSEVECDNELSKELKPLTTYDVDGSPQDAEYTGDLEEQVRPYSWEDLIAYAGVNVPVEKVYTFYTHEWLPFCVSLSKTHSFTNKVLLPNPMKPPSAHSISSKGLCSVFVMRQRHLRSIRYVLSRQMKELVHYLRSNAGKLTVGMPVWWCPWIHDVAVMVGCVKHGYMAMEAITRDVNLPLNTEHILKHIKRVFLYGTCSHPPAACGVFSSTDEASQWVRCAASIFPDQNTLETRISKILVEMTQHLPPKHMCHVKRVADKSVEAVGKRKGKHVEITVEKDAFPALPLETYLLETAKRRRLAVAKCHPSINVS